MHCRIFTIALIFCLPLKLEAQQYIGGSASGFTFQLKTNALLATAATDSLYKGSTGNGFAGNTGIVIALGITDSLYNGGTGNGFCNGTGLGILAITTDSLYSGGVGNGFTNGQGLVKQLGSVDSLYNGGPGNGFTDFQKTSAAIFIADSLYRGGEGRGETIITGTLNLAICGVTVTWNGSTSNEWSDAANWDCGIVPGPTSSVFIQAGLPRYPTVFASTEIKSLLIQQGASVTVKTGVNFKLNGH